MADNKKVPGLTEATTAALTDLCVLAVGGLARRMTLTNLKTVLGIGATPLPTLHVRDEKSSGTVGGASSAATWNQRDLNTTLTNTITGASLASDQITLPAGTYEIDANAPGYLVTDHKLRLRDTTGTATLLVGSSARSNAIDATATHAFLRGPFTIAVESVFELQHWTENEQASNGLGPPTAASVVEVYADVQIRKVA